MVEGFPLTLTLSPEYRVEGINACCLSVRFCAIISRCLGKWAGRPHPNPYLRPRFSLFQFFQ